jgi:hypothetical protein
MFVGLLSIIVVVIIVVDIMIYHDISILTIMVTQSLHTIPRISEAFAKVLQSCMWCQHGQRKLVYDTAMPQNGTGFTLEIQ